MEILAQRIIWSFVFVMILVMITKKQSNIRNALKDPVTRKAMVLTSLLISVNWLTFIWAVANERVIEASFGYFLTPLVSVMLAKLFLSESLDRFRLAACLLAVVGISIQIFSLGKLPWVSLIVSSTFGMYGLVRKKANVDSLSGLTVETGVLLPIAIVYWAWLAMQGESGFISNGSNITLLLIASGFVTAFPLLLFAAAAKKLSLTAVGFMMYINPFIQLLAGIFFFHEPFNNTQMFSFGFIWLALIVFSVGAIVQQRRMRHLANPVH